MFFLKKRAKEESNSSPAPESLYEKTLELPENDNTVFVEREIVFVFSAGLDE